MLVASHGQGRRAVSLRLTFEWNWGHWKKSHSRNTRLFCIDLWKGSILITFKRSFYQACQKSFQHKMQCYFLTKLLQLFFYGFYSIDNNYLRVFVFDCGSKYRIGLHTWFWLSESRFLEGLLNFFLIFWSYCMRKYSNFL